MRSRDPVLLLHGQPGNVHDWDGVIEALDPQLYPLAFARPGNGNRRNPGGIAYNGQAALAWLDRLGIERATVVGHSFGGAIAAWIAAEHPDRVTALVLISPAANADSLVLTDRLLALPGLGAMLTAAMFTSAGLATVLPQARERIATAFGLTEPYLRHTTHHLLSVRTLATFMVEQVAMIKEMPAIEESLSQISAPTTIIGGELDTMVPASASLKLSQQIAGARLVQIAGGRHALGLTHPQLVAQLIFEATRGRHGSLAGHDGK